MNAGHVQRADSAAKKFSDSAGTMLVAVCVTIAIVLLLIAISIGTLVDSHRAEQRESQLLTMRSDAAELTRVMSSEYLAVFAPDRSPTETASLRGVTDNAIRRVIDDANETAPLSQELHSLADSAQRLVVALRVMPRTGIELANDALADAAARFRRESHRIFDDLVGKRDQKARVAAKWLLICGLLACASLLGILILVWREFGSRQKAATEVAQARETVLREERTRARFFQAVGHDLHQPLQAIALFATGLERRVKDTEALPLLENMRSAVESMGRMLRGLTDVSRLDAGTIAPDPVALPVAEILGPIQAEFAAIAAAKGVMFAITTADLVVKTDPLMLECILRNLVSNAVRFTRSGEVSVHCRNEGDRGVIDVTDTGPGIAESDQRRIFQEFYRAASTARQTEGLGLGLSIVRRMVDLLDAKIDLRSALGRGTTFTLSLPAAAMPATTRVAVSGPIHPARELAGTRVLLVDDDEHVHRGLVPELTACGMAVVSLRDPQSVCALFEDEQAPSFDIALVDRDLRAEMTGPELLDHLAAHLQIALPALVLSGTTDFRVIKELQDSDYPWLAKPVPLPTLLHEMSRILESVRAVTPPA